MIKRFAKRDFCIPRTGISSVEKLVLGGVEQCILLQGENPGKPVLLILHGGPSMPMPGVSSKGQDYTIVTNTRELVKHFVVVFWDQRGTGKSYSKTIPRETLTVGQFISDAEELTDYLRQRFKQTKIFLAGHSWGSTIGLSLAVRSPHKFYSYTGFSQLVSWTENDRLSLEWLKQEAAKRGNQKALRELQAIGEPPFTESFKQWATMRIWQQRFNTLIYTDEAIKHPGMWGIFINMLRSETYSFKDIINSFYRGFKLVYTQRFVEELSNHQIMGDGYKIDLPVTFIHGAKDFQVHGSLVESFYNELEAKHKQLIWAPRSGHAFHPDDTKNNEQHFIRELRHLSRHSVV
ncbi:alpha/beta fold hydrolase [Paenibacillus sp. CAU 1782]